jgi:REP element-mobilizing transposase RayT
MWYFITAATHHHRPLLADEQARERVRGSLHRLAEQYEITLRAWVILHNHYHLLLKSRIGRDLPRFIGHLHGSTARQLNLDDASGQRTGHSPATGITFK